MSEFNRNELINKTLAEFSPSRKAAKSVIAAAPEPENHEIYDEDYESTFFDKFKVVVPIILIAIVCFIAYAWYTDKFAISKNAGNDIPVIKASKEPLREKPEDPGGMKIINRDKSVYDAISGKDSDKDTKAANILPAPEEPMAHDEIVKKESPEFINNLPADKAVTQDKVTSQDKATNSDPSKTAPVAEIKSGIKSEPLPAPAINTASSTPATNKEPPIPEPSTSVDATFTAAAEPAKESQPVTTPVAKETKPAEKVKAVTDEDITDIAPVKKPAPQKQVQKSDLGYRVQLGSYRSTGDAESSWKSIKNKFPDILNEQNDYIEKADLGDKGIYYRLQLSGIKNESDARKICQKLTIQKQGCFFVGK